MKILFVDDEPSILQSLQRSLRPMRNSWDMTFSSGGENALSMMEHDPFDVVVSDMRMPGMDGATLLRAVQDRFPGTIRIVLSGYFDLQTAMRAVPVAHQFLMKPCAADKLRSVVERSCRLREILDNESVRRVVTTIGGLPSVPKTYATLARCLENTDASMDEIANTVERDVGLSAKVLQLVNSAFFGLAREIPTVKMAVNYLGLDILKNLVLAIEMFRVFRLPRPVEGFSLEAMQDHAGLTAKIVSRLPIPAHLQNAAVVSALLHDVGKLVLAARLPSYMERALAVASRDQCTFHDAEQKCVGATHAEIGGYLLGLWGLAPVVVEIVANHHAPTRVADPSHGFDALAGVYIADILAYQHSARSSGLTHPDLDTAYLDALGVSDSLPAWHAIADEAALSLSPIAEP
jgi:HD-like signal output (HDOD) protein